MDSLNVRPGRHLENRACDFWGEGSIRSQQFTRLSLCLLCIVYLPNIFPPLIAFSLYYDLERWNGDPNLLAVSKHGMHFSVSLLYAWYFIHLEFPHTKPTRQNSILPWGAYLGFYSLLKLFFILLTTLFCHSTFLYFVWCAHPMASTDLGTIHFTLSTFSQLCSQKANKVDVISPVLQMRKQI